MENVLLWEGKFCEEVFMPFLPYLVRGSGLCLGSVWFDPASGGFTFGVLPGQGL